jgi:hypothetical protein
MLTNFILVGHDGKESPAVRLGALRPAPVGRPLRQGLQDLKLPKVDGVDVWRCVRADPRSQTLPGVVLTTSRPWREVATGYEWGVTRNLVQPVACAPFPPVVEPVGLAWPRRNEVPVGVR